MLADNYQLWTYRRPVLTVCFSGRHVREHEQAAVFCEAAEQSQATQQLLQQPVGEAAVVEFKIHDGHQVSGRWVQTDAAAPDVALRHAADSGADGGEVVWYLVCDKKENTQKLIAAFITIFLQKISPQIKLYLK